MVATTSLRHEPRRLPSSSHLDQLVSGGQVLRSGGGPAVQQAQQLLGAHGFSPGPFDGIMGPKTSAAVIAFQRSRGLAADGIIGPETLRELHTPVSAGAGATAGSRGIIPSAGERIPGQTGADFRRAADLEAARRQRAAQPAGPGSRAAAQPGEVQLAPRSMSEREKFDHYATMIRARGGEVNPGGKPTVLGIRGVDIRGDKHASVNSRAYDDTFVVLTADKRVLELRGATHAGQTRSSLVDHVGRISAGHYMATANGNHKGQPSYHVKTLGGSGAIPGARDRNHDGAYSAEELSGSRRRGDALTEILFHVGLENRPSSIGCQTLPPEAMRQLIDRVGGPRGSFSFSLVEAQ
ncbi:MAG: peptidoglycan-binding domain-containing protein [Myxococcota bacterium]